MRRYGHGPFPSRENPKKCLVEVADETGWHFSQCSRPRGHGKDGLLCKQHAKIEAQGRRLNIPEDKEEA